MKLLKISLLVLFLIPEAFAASLPCPPVADVKAEPSPEGMYKHTYYAFSFDGRKLTSGKIYNKHPCGYCFTKYRPEYFNPEASSYDEQTNRLVCAYFIHERDAGTDADWGYVLDVLVAS